MKPYRDSWLDISWLNYSNTNPPEITEPWLGNFWLRSGNCLTPIIHYLYSAYTEYCIHSAIRSSREKHKEESRRRKRKEKIGSKLFAPTAWTADPSQHRGLLLCTEQSMCILRTCTYQPHSRAPRFADPSVVRAHGTRLEWICIWYKKSLPLTLFGERRLGETE